MTSKNKKFMIYGLAAVAVLAATGASAYYVKQSQGEQQVAQVDTPTYSAPAQQQAAPVQQAPACDDGNIVGVGAGAVAGGLVGNQFGKGSGNTAATIGGAAGGAMLGQKYIPTDGATCR